MLTARQMDLAAIVKLTSRNRAPSMPWHCHLASKRETTIPDISNDTDIVKGLPGGVNCKNDKTKTPPYLCQTPKPGICCKDDADCKANGPGSYCQTYKPKSGTASMPWHCHLASKRETTI